MCRECPSQGSALNLAIAEQNVRIILRRCMSPLLEASLRYAAPVWSLPQVTLRGRFYLVQWTLALPSVARCRRPHRFQILASICLGTSEVHVEIFTLL